MSQLGKKIYPFLGLIIIIAHIFIGQNTYASPSAVHSSAEPVFSQFPSPQIIDDAANKAIVLYKSDSWSVRKTFPYGYIDIYDSKQGREGKPIAAPLSFRKDSHPLWIGQDIAENLYIIVYDVAVNSPSGRKLANVSEGLTVYKISKDEKIKKIASQLQLGGIDTIIYANISNKKLNICGDNACYSIDDGKNVSQWNTRFLEKYEFVEVDFNFSRAAAIVREKYDDRFDGRIKESKASYYMTVFDDVGMERFEQIAPDIPWGIHWRGTDAIYKIARTIDDYRDVLLYDFNKLPLGGTADFGANNLEGRVAWSQAYYLNGLISLAKKDVAPLQDIDIGAEALAKRVNSEVGLIVDLCQTQYPGLLVKRYSIDREPLLFALHVGRVAHLLQRALPVMDNNVALEECLKMLRRELRSLTHTVEEEVSIEIADGIGTRYLAYRKGYPFWADGANVPFNYVSGYISGLLGKSAILNDIDTAANFLQPIIRLEFASIPRETWRYWWGAGDQGWSATSSTSLNTPEYVGNKQALAHITYRTMDMQALLLFAQYRVGELPNDILSWARVLVERGMLLPSLNETYADQGQERAPLDILIARRYARSAAAWEFQSQVWALNQLSLFSNSHENQR